MRPFILSIIQMCASLWEISRDQHFIKGAVVKLLNDLIKVTPFPPLLSAKTLL